MKVLEQLQSRLGFLKKKRKTAPLSEMDILLADDEYKALLKQYTKSYLKLVEALPKRKQRLVADFAKVSEEIVIRRFNVLITNARKG